MTDRRATYRLQLHAGFGFRDAARLAPQLVALGISHAYLSPVTQAAPGSAHGYDVVDPSLVSDDLGGIDGLRAAAAALRAHGIGLLLDIVPNHMSVAARGNRWWWDVLTMGRGSPYAAYFDINWDHPELRDRVLVPVLGDPIDAAVEKGEVRLRIDDGIVVAYHGQRLPLRPETLVELLAGTGALADARAVAAAEFVEERTRLTGELAARLDAEPGLHAEVAAALVRHQGGPLLELLEQQHYALRHWQVASAVLNYRRFFDIPTLVGVRVEDESVADATHTLIDALLDEGLADGVRVDHIDGLRLPRRYAERMRARHPEAWLLFEKIAERGEHLPEWLGDGTTGYDIAALTTGLLLEPAGWSILQRRWARLCPDQADAADVIAAAKADVMAGSLRPALDRLTRLAVAVAHERGRPDLADEEALHEAIVTITGGLDVYRTYIADAAPTDADRDRIEHAGASGLLRDVLLAETRTTLETELVLRWQQATTVVMAKGVEDTACYRHLPVSAICEVGGSLTDPLVDIDTFHAANLERQARFPHALLATSTHDTKRSEDVRARLAVLTEVADEWDAFTARWRDVPCLDAGIVELFHQTAAGAWPIDAERLSAYLLKAAHEAKLRTSWTAPDEAYDAALDRLVRERLDDRTFVEDLERIVERIRIPGRINSLAVTLLRATSPGACDTYQGQELWDLSLVDPDNRRPVDFVTRARLLAAPPDFDVTGDSGIAKLSVLRAALRAGAAGAYAPLRATGPHAHRVIAFARGDTPRLVTVVPRFSAGGTAMPDTTLPLPDGGWRNLMDEQVHEGTVPVDALLTAAPVALLEREP
jgi:(1->4)-alpha-D-glucan 1-alpha-D-glucosylmutase